MMSKSIDLSLCVNPGQEIGYLENLIRDLPYPVHITALSWEGAWRAFTDYAVHQHGANVSQVGAPLIGDLVAMNALRPFSARELAQMGGEHAFEPVAWHSANRSLHGQVWAIPWTADPRVLFYWQDMLDSAGIEETTAFQSPIQMELTLERLQSSGIATPWVLPTAFPLAAVQTAASWIWGAGGEIARQDGKRTLFCEAPALEGLQRYYSLYRFMPLIGQLISDLQALELFINRQAAVTMGSLYLGTQILAQAHPEHLSMLGTALPPGPALVGGSNLVVWAHTQSQPEAAALIVFLTSPALMSFHCQRTGYLPTRLDVLNSSPFNTDPRFKAYAQALQSGKPFPIIKAGGLLENSLASSLVNIWIDILRSGGGNIRSFLEKHLVPLGRRLDITLSQFE